MADRKTMARNEAAARLGSTKEPMPPLVPVDRERCQADVPNGAFRMGGPTHSRCGNTPTVVAREKEPGEDGRRGAMSLCARCKSKMVEKFTSKKIPLPDFSPIKGQRTCCSCKAGILVMNGNEVQACDECGLFESDEDAVAAVEALLQVFHDVYESLNDGAGSGEGSTVADAFEAIVERAKGTSR